MELYLNKTSPYARVARICVLEKGLTQHTQLNWVDPWVEDADLLNVNPHNRIPVLITEKGEAISESLLIAIYLDQFEPSASLFGTTNSPAILSLAGLGQGLMDAAFQTTINRKHYGADIDNSTLGQRRTSAIQRCLQALEKQTNNDAMTSDLHIGQITIAVALDYINLRLPEVNWQTHYPTLARWFDHITTKPSFSETAFPNN